MLILHFSSSGISWYFKFFLTWVAVLDVFQAALSNQGVQGPAHNCPIILLTESGKKPDAKFGAVYQGSPEIHKPRGEHHHWVHGVGDRFY